MFQLVNRLVQSSYTFPTNLRTATGHCGPDLELYEHRASIGIRISGTFDLRSKLQLALCPELHATFEA